MRSESKHALLKKIEREQTAVASIGDLRHQPEHYIGVISSNTPRFM